MLVLTRAIEEEVVLTIHGEKIVVKVLGYNHGKVRLGFTAPDHCGIFRRELLDRTTANQHGKHN